MIVLGRNPPPPKRLHLMAVAREISALASYCDVVISYENANDCEGTFKTDFNYLTYSIRILIQV